MEGKSKDISMQDAMRLAQSDTGKQLLNILRSSNPDVIEQATRQASTGDYDELKSTLSDFMKTPEAKQLLEQLRRQLNG